VGLIARYLAPVLALLLALAAAASVTRLGRLAAGLALATTAALGLAVTVRHVQRVGGPALLTAPAEAVERRLIVNDPLPGFHAAGSLPAGARVLFVGEPRGHRFPRAFVAPSYYDACLLRDPVETLPSAEAVRGWLEAGRFTHLLINRGELARLAAGYPVEPWRSEAGRQRWSGLLRLLGAPVIAVDGVEIYAIAGAGLVQP